MPNKYEGMGEPPLISVESNPFTPKALKQCFNKKIYYSWQVAQRAAETQTHQFKRKGSVYKCPQCNFFHITFRKKHEKTYTKD